MSPIFAKLSASLGRSVGRLGPRARKVLRYVGFAALGLVSFVFAFQLTFPFDRVKDKIVDVLADKYEVTIGSVERSIVPGRVYFHALSLRTRPAKAGDVATTFYIARLEIDLGLLALLRGAVAVDLDAQIGSGEITGQVALAKSGTSIELDGEDLPSASLPMREVLGLPMSGKVRFAFELDLPSEKAKTGKVAADWAKAEGRVEFACPSGCTIGDGKSKLKLTTRNARQQAFLDESGGGIDFGKVNIDSLFANVEIKRGKLEVTRFDAKSGDGELHIELTMALAQDIQSSEVTGCLRFRGSDALLRREPKTHAAISTTGAPLGPDNLFHITLQGPLRTMRRLGKICGPGTSTGTGSPGGTPPRPNLTVTPEVATQPPGTDTPPIQPPPAAAPVAEPPGPITPDGTDVPHVPPPSPIGEGPAPVVEPSPGVVIPPSAAPPTPSPEPAAGSDVLE